MTPERVTVYIDGDNLYYGLKAAGLSSSRWLDLAALSQSLLEPQQELAFVRYFTTRVRNDAGAVARQSLYIGALGARGDIRFDYGHFLSKTMTCTRCRTTWPKNEEKKTDVNIAVQILEDAFDDLFDVAIVVSGDSDLAPPIESVQRRFTAKRVVVAFPPKRYSAVLERTARASIRISKTAVRNSRLPNPVFMPIGIRLDAPLGWMP